MLPPQAITEFRALWKKHYAEDLPQEQATQRAQQVFTLIRLLTQPTPRAAPVRKLAEDQHPRKTALPKTVQAPMVSSTPITTI